MRLRTTARKTATISENTNSNNTSRNTSRNASPVPKRRGPKRAEPAKTKKPKVKNIPNVPKNTVAGDVYVFGSGDCAQLGMGEDVLSLAKPQIHPFFADKNIIQVYSMGCNDDGALGHEEPEFSPGLVLGLEDQKVVNIACGDSISAALTADGKVFAWGTFRSSRGIFGFDEHTTIQKRATQVLGLKNQFVKYIASGANHLIALTSDGKMWSWGCTEQGQLGRRLVARQELQTLIPRTVTNSRSKLNSGYKTVVCGSYHTLTINEQGEVFGFGLNNYGQLGLGDEESRVTAEQIDPENFDGETPIDLAAGEHHSIALTSSGHVFSFGRGDSGQLGLPEEPKHSPLPKKIPSLKNVEMISSGSNHCLAKTKSGEIYSWGYGEMLQLGNGKEEDEVVPFKLKFDGSKVLQIQGGGQHSMILVQK
ncbi:RCC1/BLIP-II [Rozella allomycis CSF55]|uniref:RCC1/BLIP-II n=1 Tax=Rozella allomycis (strain CSF55) TaxID=988480 RepID=A0A4P9YIT1_ROZAC|nr:RCC1/BLIP-II [Rozella allomycis CSF55]